MTSTFAESREDEEEYSIDSQAFFGELNKSVSRLRALSYEIGGGDDSVVNLEHTLDAILNMAQKTTLDESIASLDSLRVAKPVQKNKEKEKDSTRFCSLRLLLCGRNERKEDNFGFPEFSSYPSKLGTRSKESFWNSGTPEHRQSCRVVEVVRDDCDHSNGFSSTNSKKDLVLRIGRKQTDDVSSLSSDLFGTRRSHASETRQATVTRSSPGGGCLTHYEDLLSCRAPHRQLPIDEGQNPFVDLLSCHRSPMLGQQEGLQDEAHVACNNEMKILGVRNKAGDNVSIRSGSQSTSRSKGNLRKSQSKISRMEAEHSPKLMTDQMSRSDRATIYIYNQSTDQTRKKR